MDSVSTNISRRSVALGAPSALALGSMGSLAKLAPLGAVAALGAAHTPASAALAFVPSVNGFMEFYHSTDYSKVIAFVLRFYIQARYDPPAKVFTDPVVFDQWWGGSLTSTQRSDIRQQQRIAHAELNKKFDVARTYVALWVHEISSRKTSDLMLQLHAKPIALDYVMHFLKMSVPAADFAELEQDMATHTKVHDGRFLRGTTAKGETLKVKQGALPGQATYEVDFGNKRKLMKRKNMTKKSDWGMKAEIFPNPSGEPTVLYSQSYEPSSHPTHGMNSTTLEPTVAPEVSTAYTLSPSQRQSIANITSDDIDKNGAYGNMTADDSKKALAECTEILARGSGLLYESYAAASYMLTGFSQALIASIRFQLGNPDKVLGINLDALMQNALEISFKTPEFQALTSQQALRFRTEFNALAAVLSGQAVWTGYNLFVAKKNAAITGAPNAAELAKQLEVQLATSTALSVASLGYLGFAAMVPTVRGAVRANIKALVPALFAASDIGNGLVTLTYAVRNNKPWSDPNKLSTIGYAVVRISTGIIGSIDPLYKCWHWNASVSFWRDKKFIASYGLILTGSGATIASGLAVITALTGMFV